MVEIWAGFDSGRGSQPARRHRHGWRILAEFRYSGRLDRWHRFG